MIDAIGTITNLVTREIYEVCSGAVWTEPYKEATSKSGVVHLRDITFRSGSPIDFAAVYYLDIIATKYAGRRERHQFYFKFLERNFSEAYPFCLNFTIELLDNFEVFKHVHNVRSKKVHQAN